MAAVAVVGIEASWLDDGEKRALRAEFATSLARLRPTAQEQITCSPKGCRTP